MSGPTRSLPDDPAVRTVRRWLTRTFVGRALLAGIVLKLLAAVLRRILTGSAAVETVDTFGDLTIVTAAVALAYRLVADARERLLWRVRSRLTLSYIFIGFVPVLLIVVLFVTSGALLFFNVSQYVARDGMQSLVEQAAFLAESAAVGLQNTTPADLPDRLRRRQAGAEKSFPFVSYAVVPAMRTCRGAPGTGGSGPVSDVITAGPWQHVAPPAGIPSWVPCEGSAALVAYTDSDVAGAAARIVARAVAWPDGPEPHFAVVVDVPFSEAVHHRLQRATGIDLGDVSSQCTAPLPRGRALDLVAAPGGAANTGAGGRLNPFTRTIGWVAFLQYVNWDTGTICGASMHIDMTLAGLYSRVSATPGTDTFQIGLMWLMALIVVLLLVIQFAAFMTGLTLARSITGSVHELFAGTERVRRGDFAHKIGIRSRDQLGALAESFNSMTGSIEDLLQQKAEKERLEQELRIARSIQMSLLPQSGISIPGMSVAAHCEPAREVGGDYYDYLPIDHHRFGLLIADVAGKGTSAALYMAELKGLMLSLSQQHTSPRRLLIDANRIISRHLDTRSFITITYAVVDTEARTLTYARAGHTPLIYVPGPEAPSRAAQILAPDGLVLGLQIDNGERFDQLLQEATLPLGYGDLFLFYTDGLTEAMDIEGNCFGDARLSAVLREHADLPFDELRERILREIAAFSGSALQQDDMTMLLLKVESAGDAGGRRIGRRGAEAGAAAGQAPVQAG